MFAPSVCPDTVRQSRLSNSRISLSSALQSTRVIKIFHQELPEGRRFAIIGVRCEMSSNFFRSSLNARAPGERDQMNDRVGRSADGHVGRDRIFKRGSAEDVSRLQIFPDHLDDAAAAVRSPCANGWRRLPESKRRPARSCPASQQSRSSSKPCPSSCNDRANARCRLPSPTIRSR